MAQNNRPHIHIDADGTIHRDNKPAAPNASVDAPARDTAKVAPAQKNNGGCLGCLLTFLAFEASSVALVFLLAGLGHLGIFLAIVIGAFVALLVYSSYVKRKPS